MKFWAGHVCNGEDGCCLQKSAWLVDHAQRDRECKRLSDASSATHARSATPFNYYLTCFRHCRILDNCPRAYSMPPKRTRRQSPAPAGLGAGERLKRAKLTRNSSYSAWGWVGTDVSDASDITLEHRLATCGLLNRSTHTLCLNKYIPTEDGSAPTTRKSQENPAPGELADDVIVISDDEGPSCSSKSCKSNPYCLNYLGQDKWEDKGKTA